MTSRVEVDLDDQIFTTQVRGGVSRYFVELLAQCRADPDLGIDLHVPFRYALNEHLLERGIAGVGRPPLPAFAQRARVVQTLNRALARRRPRAAIVHHTYLFARELDQPATHRVCTVYDMIPELVPDVPTTPGVDKERYARTCDAVLCISQTTKDDLLDRYGELHKPVVVTPLGVSDHYFAATSGAVDRPYALFVGQRFGYKNFDLVLRTLSRLDRSGVDLVLRCVGGTPFSQDEQARMHELGIADRVERASADDDALPALYAGATCLVFPSRYEGFGLPIVEAFAAGCPVVAADMPCSREVGGPAAHFVEADDDEAMAAVVERLATDTEFRATTVAAGRARAQEFSWRKTAELTAEVYRSVAS